MAKAENEMMSYPSINEDLKLQSSISPEYKSSWNDVNITVTHLTSAKKSAISKNSC